MTSLLSIRNLSIGFDTDAGLIPGVQDVDLEVRRGEIVALVGESGSGKSITALSILGLLPAPAARVLGGEIVFTRRDGQAVDLLKQPAAGLRQIRGGEIAMIFQEPMTSLNPVYTCGDQVVEAIRVHRKMGPGAVLEATGVGGARRRVMGAEEAKGEVMGAGEAKREVMSAGEAKREALALFEKVRLPDPERMFGCYPHQLSGGQKQRVMIAMAMSGGPSLLICDEPTTALDVTVQNTILELIRSLQRMEDLGVIFITHDLGVVAEIADRALVMYKGRVAEQGSVAELFRRPQHPYTKGLLNCRPALHRKGERLPMVSDYLAGVGMAEGVTPAERVALADEVASAERVAPAASPIPEPVIGEVMMRVEDLRVWYPARRNWLGKPLQYTKAVDGVSFDVRKGEVLGLVGESGCGKTTLGRALLRLVEPTAGKIDFEGVDWTGLGSSALKQRRSQIQLIFQDPYSSLNPRLRIGSAIAEAMAVHGMGGEERGRKRRVVELLEKVSLRADHYDRYPHEFSGGQRQRIVIARALSLQPSFLICDESVSALDVSVQAQVLNLLNDLRREFGFTVVFISHDLSVIRYISDRIVVMNKGRIEEMGDAEEVYLRPRTEYTKRLLAAIPGV